MLKFTRKIALLALLLGATPALGVPTTSNPEVAAPLSDEGVAGVDASLAGYGAWLVQLNSLQQPLQEGLQAFGPQWQSALSQGTPREAAARLRPIIAALTAQVARTNAQVAALPEPDMGIIPISADLHPRAMKQSTIANNERLGALIGSYNGMLDALLRNDASAMVRSAGQTMQGLRLALNSRVLMLRAQQASIAPGMIGREVMNVQIVHTRVLERIFAAWPSNLQSGIDRTVAADLMTMASELDQSADATARELDQHEAMLRPILADAQAKGDANRVRVLQRALATFAADRPISPLARELATTLRAGSRTFVNGRVTQQSLGALLERLHPFNERINEVGRAEAAALAGGQ